MFNYRQWVPSVKIKHNENLTDETFFSTIIPQSTVLYFVERGNAFGAPFMKMKAEENLTGEIFVAQFANLHDTQ